MNVAELFTRCLEAEGVERIFGVPGEEVLDLLDAISRSSIQFVSTRHEQGAAFMADAHGRLTGRAGVCLATLGPGATNLITGVADANLDCAPLVAISGQTGLARIHKESHQYVDLESIFQPVTKWSARIDTPDVTPEIVRKAFRLAQAEKPGATYIQLPEGVASSEAFGEPMRPTWPPEVLPGEAVLGQAAKLIAMSRSPIVLVGNGLIRARAAPELRDLVHRQRLPTAETFMGKGALDADDDLLLGTVGLQARDLIMCGFDQADLVVCVGYDFVEYAPRFWNPGKDKTIIHIAEIPAEVDEHYQAAVEVVGNVRASLGALNAVATPAVSTQPHLALRTAIRAEFTAFENDDTYPVKPQRAIADLRKVLDRNAIVTSDVGAHKVWLARLFPTHEPGTILISNGYAAMGFGLPAAISAKINFPDRQVVAVCGDGGFMMNSQELETARRVGAAVVIMIWVDGSYSLIGWKEEMRFGRRFDVDFDNPNFQLYAHAYGLPGFCIQRTEDLLPTLRRALVLREPSIVAVPIDYFENQRLTARLGELTCPV